MKKRISSILLTVVMIVSMIPLGAITAFAEDNGIPGGGEGKTAWTSDNALPQSSGKYYLTKDVMLANAWTVKAGADISLDLNGHTIRRDLPTAKSNGYVIGVSGKLTLSDSSAEKTGLITGGNNTGNGGGLYINSDAVVNLADCRIEGNKAIGAAGIYNAGTLTATRCSITNNHAIGNAGGIYTSAGMMTFIDCEIKNNRSDNYGGAFFVDYTASVTLDGCTVSGNAAKNGGGAFEMESADGKLVLKDSSVIGNSVDVKNKDMFKGGGIHFYLGSVTLKGRVVLKDNLCASLPNNICVRNTTVNFNASALTADSEFYLNDGALAVISGITKENLGALHMENGYHIDFSEAGKLIAHRPDFSGKYIDNGNGTHARRCQLCSRLDTAEAHIDANKDGNCDICGEIELKTGNLGLLTEGLNTSSAATVNFGTDKDGNPVAFRVIGDENSGVKAPEGCLTLISADLVAPPQPYNTKENYSANYKGSMLQATVNSSVALSDVERAAVRPRTLAGGKKFSNNTNCDGVGGSTVENALLWAPTTADAVAMSEGLRKASNHWWLCSIGFTTGIDSYTYRAAVVYGGTGDVWAQGNDVKDGGSFGVRSAFYLDPSSVLLATSDSGSIKLTLVDKTRSFDVTSVSGTAEKLTVSYTGAKTGSNESIAYLVVDADGMPKNCVTVAAVTAKNGTVEFDRPALASGERLYLANVENKPGADLSSEPVQIEMPCIHDFSGTEYHDNGDGTHSAVCVKCGVISSDSVAHITGSEYRDNGNGTHSQKCRVCGGCAAAVYHTYESVDAETHRCKVCSFSGKHTDDGTCGICGKAQYYYEYNETTGEFDRKPIPKSAVELNTDNALYTNSTDMYNNKFHEEWYIVTKSIKLENRPQVVSYLEGGGIDENKEIHLILADGVTLEAPRGIRVVCPFTIHTTTTDINKMGTIDAQSTLMGEAGIGSGWDQGEQAGFNSYPANKITIHGGKFIVRGGPCAAGIGSGWSCSDTGEKKAGDITIYGGKFEAYGGSIKSNAGGAAIGSGHLALNPDTDINIYGGTFSLLDGVGGAAIGSGGKQGSTDNVSSIGDINIYGGEFINVKPGLSAPGIGAGARAKCGNITIYDGIIHDIAGSSGVRDFQGGNNRYGAAAIGSGYYGTCGNITIKGGLILNAFSYDTGAAIGSGRSGSCGNITIEGGDLVLVGGFDAPGIGAGSKGHCSKVTITGGYIEAVGGGIYSSYRYVTKTEPVIASEIVYGPEIITSRVVYSDVMYGNIAPDRDVLFVGRGKTPTCTESGYENYFRIVERHEEDLGRLTVIFDRTAYYSSVDSIDEVKTNYKDHRGYYITDYWHISGQPIGDADEAALAAWLETPVSEGGGLIPATGHIDEDGDNTCDKCGAENIHYFTDLAPSAWSYDYIFYVLEKGLMQGVSDTKFAPQTDTSRAMIVTILWRMEGEPVTDYAMSFKDVKDDRWYTDAIRWAQSSGIVEGYNTGKFGPNDPITREQMATILYRYAKLHEIDVTNTNTLAGFTDVNKVSVWALDAMRWANAVGLVQGRTATTLVPEVSITRAEAATMVQRYCETFKK